MTLDDTLCRDCRTYYFLFLLSDQNRMFNVNNLTQVELSEKSGVGLRLVRELEQGKQTLRLDKVNQILNLFGSEVGVVPITKTDER